MQSPKTLTLNVLRIGGFPDATPHIQFSRCQPFAPQGECLDL